MAADASSLANEEKCIATSVRAGVLAEELKVKVSEYRLCLFEFISDPASEPARHSAALVSLLDCLHALCLALDTVQTLNGKITVAGSRARIRSSLSAQAAALSGASSSVKRNVWLPSQAS